MLKWKRFRKVLLCVTGGIAAYKIPEFVSRLRQRDCEVETVLTEAAETMVSPLALSTLSGRRVWRQADFLSADRGFEIPHIHLADWAEVVVVAPCTANTAAGIAHGRAGNIVEAALLATRAPVILFPAMNKHMFEHPATQENLRLLVKNDIRVVDPEFGSLACGYEGKGRLPETALILEETARALSPERDLCGKHILVTAGPTWEFLDPVRFISNPSSGKMGLAMARTAWYRGAEVRVVLGPVSQEAKASVGGLHGMEVYDVRSAVEMRDAVMENLGWADCVVKAAAVGDYRAKDREEHKIKREKKDSMTLSLVQNPDIAAEVGANKRTDQFLIGFAAETENFVENARVKMQRKGLDLVAVNDVTASDSGFEVDTNTVRLISKEDELELSGSKEEVAAGIWEAVVLKGLR